MKLNDIREIFRKELEYLYPSGEIDSFFYMLTGHYLGLERFILVMEPAYALTHEEEQPLFEALSLLHEEYPIQYILGKADFMDLELHVNEHVLIPRPETEELVRWILEDCKGMHNDLRILDIGTGSGCIAIALAKGLAGARVSALDISAEALKIAGKNAEKNGASVTFIHADVLQPWHSDENWDLIVSNPPYVTTREKQGLKNNVKRYEPARALFVPDAAPLMYFEHIADLAVVQLKPGGMLYFEINQFLAMETRQLLHTRNFSEITLRKDMFGNDRMIRSVVPARTSEKMAEHVKGSRL